MKNQILIQENNFNKIRKQIKENPDKEIIFSSNNDELNRKILEKEKINILLLNQSNKRDKFKQRNSGFNQVLAKIAKKNKTIIGINLDEIIESHPRVYTKDVREPLRGPDKSSSKISTEGKNKAEILARIQQNIKLCNKNKLKMKFIALKEKNQRDSHDLKALGLVLGMPTWMTSSL